MPEDDQAITVLLLKSMHEDIKEIKDNHLPHICDSVKEIRTDVDSLMDLRDDILLYLKNHIDKALMVVVAGIGASIGVPLVLN
jgi:hypothetical protein